MKRILLLIVTIISIARWPAAAQQTGKFKDERDGTFYKTIEIGDQTWMAENLVYKAATGCWAYPDDGYEEYEIYKNYKIYGYLYNWEAANKSCPAGWHLPTSDEWVNLIEKSGGKDFAATGLKSKTGWGDTTNGSNLSGFNALPGGYVVYEPGYKSTSFKDIIKRAVWWNATEDESELVWNFFIAAFNATHVFNQVASKDNGYSVRCVQNLVTK